MISNFSGKTMVFRNERNGNVFYSCGISKKDKDGKNEYGNINIQFKKGVEISNRAMIDLKKAWLSFYKNKDNHTVPYIMCTEFEFVDGQEPPSEPPVEFNSTDDFVPF